MHIDRKFPTSRLRRLRANNTLINLVSESSLSSNDLIQPLFIKENLKGTEKIDSMPGVLRYSKESVIDEVEDLLENNINTIALFPSIDSSRKDSNGKEALNKSNLICESIQKIKSKFPEMLIIADVALDPYTDHGHDGILKSNYVDNDLTLDVLKAQSLILAESGADILDIDWQVDMADAKRLVAGKATVRGNLNPSTLLLQGTPEEIYEEAVRIINTAGAGGGIILGSGCDIPIPTPYENIDAITKASKDTKAG